MGTQTKLVELLEQKPQDEWRDEIIRKAKEGIYHDYRSPLAAPKIELVSDLERAQYYDLSTQVKLGKFDEYE